MTSRETHVGGSFGRSQSTITGPCGVDEEFLDGGGEEDVGDDAWLKWEGDGVVDDVAGRIVGLDISTGAGAGNIVFNISMEGDGDGDGDGDSNGDDGGDIDGSADGGEEGVALSRLSIDVVICGDGAKDFLLWMVSLLFAGIFHDVCGIVSTSVRM